MRLDKSIHARFWKKVSKGEPGECWLWTASTRAGGYGRLNIGGRSVLAHRISWTIKNGPIPDGMLVCHRCDNPSCVNPEHLFIGTQSDNIKDMYAKGRDKTQLIPGENHPDAKLNWLQIRRIRERYAKGGITQKLLAKQYGVHQSLISYIVNRKRWKKGEPR